MRFELWERTYKSRNPTSLGVFDVPSCGALLESYVTGQRVRLSGPDANGAYRIITPARTVSALLFVVPLEA